MTPSFNTKVQRLSKEGCSFSSKAEGWLSLVLVLFCFCNEFVSIFASLRERAKGKVAGSREPLRSIDSMENEGSETPFVCSNHNPSTCILCSIKSNLPQGKPDSSRPNVCSKSTSHMACFNKSPLLPTALFQSQIPQAPGMDHSVFWVINPESSRSCPSFTELREQATCLRQTWAWEAAADT